MNKLKALLIGYIIGLLAIIGGSIYIAAHFATKYW